MITKLPSGRLAQDVDKTLVAAPHGDQAGVPERNGLARVNVAAGESWSVVVNAGADKVTMAKGVGPCLVMVRTRAEAGVTLKMLAAVEVEP